MKLKGGSLFLVLVIAMVVAIISSSMIMLSYLNRVQVFNNNLYVNLKNNVESGMAILLASKDTTFAQDGIYVDLYGAGTDSVYVKKQDWGIFGYVLAKANAKNVEVKKHYLIGQALAEELNCAIYLSNQGRSLSVCGDTKITGNLYLPEAGIRREYSPEPFTGMDLFKGKEHKSTYSLPKMNKRIVHFLEACESLQSQNLPEERRDSLVNSFENPTIVLRLKKTTMVPYRVIKGNVMILSDSVLHLDNNQEVEDIICIARGITLSDNFKGIGQFFAHDSIIVGVNVKLQYPTVLGLIKKDFRYTKPFIKVGQDSQIKGIVFAIHDVIDLAGSLVQYRKGSFLEGISYAEGFTEVNGKVYGSVLTNKFVLNTNSSIYENYLMNATIDETRRSKQFLSGTLWEGKGQKKIVKCLY